jgi:uncharacterized protein (DUF2336 family)
MRERASGKAAVGLDTTVFDAVIAEGDAVACRQLAVQLATFLADPTAPAVEKDAVVPAVLKLARSPDVGLRRELARRLGRCPTLHADIVFTVAADHDEIALPFLANSPALDAWRMMAVLQVGDENRQVAIASRLDIHPKVVAAIAAKGPAEVVGALLDNPACRLRPTDYRGIYLRFADETEIIERLFARTDLPPEVRILHTRYAAARIESLLVERGWMAPSEAESLLAEAEEATILRLLETESGNLDRLMAFLCARDMLHASLILRAACRGRMAVVERAIAWLSSMPRRRVEALIAGQGSRALKAMFGAAGLPSDAFPLFRAAVEAWRKAGAAAEAMSPEQFGHEVVEALMTCFPDIPGHERARLLDLVSRFTDGRTRALAHRLRDKVVQAA